jgi:hypothetical protein
MFSVTLEFASGTRCARAARLLAPLVPFRSSFLQLFLPFESSKRVSLYYPCSTLEQVTEPHLCAHASLPPSSGCCHTCRPFSCPHFRKPQTVAIEFTRCRMGGGMNVRPSWAEQRQARVQAALRIGAAVPLCCVGVVAAARVGDGA